MSEIGEIGSPARIPFTVMLCAVAASLLVFAAEVGIFAFPLLKAGPPRRD
jgi:hypothetical protein